MRAWIKPIRTLIAATALFCISNPTNVLADPLDVWHTNATFSASGIAYGNGKFVAVSGTSLQVSPDGVSWTQYISPPVLHYEGIAFGGGIFMAYGYPVSTNSSGPCYILQSSDGLTWSKVNETPSPIRGATYGNGRFVFVGDQIISTTLNPFQWSEFQLALSLGGVTFGAGRFVAVSADTSPSAYILSSTDTLIWRYDYSQTSGETLRTVAYGNGKFVATWRTNYSYGGFNYSDQGFLTSSNLASWNRVVLTDYTYQSSDASGIAFGGGYFIGAAPYGRISPYGIGKTYTSQNGLDWANRVGADCANVFCFGVGTFVASGDPPNRLLQSDVFAPSTNPPPSYLSIASYPGVTIEGIEGKTYRIEYSTNLAPGSTWLALTNISLPSSTYLWVDASSPTLGRRFYRAVLIE